MDNVNLTKEMKEKENYLLERIVERNKGTMYRSYECFFHNKSDAMRALKDLNKLSTNVWELKGKKFYYYWLQIKGSSV